MLTSQQGIRPTNGREGSQKRRRVAGEIANLGANKQTGKDCKEGEERNRTVYQRPLEPIIALNSLGRGTKYRGGKKREKRRRGRRSGPRRKSILYEPLTGYGRGGRLKKRIAALGFRSIPKHSGEELKKKKKGLSWRQLNDVRRKR